jgi:hypothetical protein
MTTTMTMAMAMEKSNNQLRDGGEKEDFRCRKKRQWLWRSGDG